MPRARTRIAPQPTMSMHLFGQVPLEDLHNLQRRLAYEAASREEGRISVLLCEHEPLITVGRGGSWADIQLSPEQLLARQLEVQFLARGGGCALHGPGRLELYAIAPLARLRWSVGDYLRRLQIALATALEQLGIQPQQRGDDHPLWGKSGVLASFGVAVRHGIALHGAALNVCPENNWHRRVLTLSGNRQSAMGSLLTEHAPAGRMAEVRTTLLERLPSAFGCSSSQIFSGHSLLPDHTLEYQLRSAA